MAFDGIVCKAIASELNMLSGARMDKVFQPSKNNIVLGFYSDGKNYALNCSIDPGYYRLNLTTNSKPNPKVAPNFCMVLRKHIIGLRLKSVYTLDLERVIFIEFEGFNDIDEIINLKLVIELMGRHSNIILLDDNNVIIDSLRHIKEIDNTYRNILPHYKYQFPTTNKINFYDINSSDEFENHLNCEINNDTDLANFIAKTFNGISNSFIVEALNNIKKDNSSYAQTTSSHTAKTSFHKDIYNYISNTVNNIDNLKFKLLSSGKDYTVEIVENKKPFELNFAIDDFYTVKENNSNFKIYRDSVLKLILSTLKKYNKRLYNIDAKLKQCENMDVYKLYGELITANLYKIPEVNTEHIELENYYDNNNLIRIPLDKKYSPNENAKRYFKKYNKLKNALEIVSIQKKETIQELKYIESVVYELESATTVEEIDTIYDEITENSIFKMSTSKSTKKMKVKKSRFTKNKTVKFNPIKYIVDNHTILVGRNNKENDYLTLKFSKKSDYWFHTKDIHGSHVILKVEANEKISDDLLIKCSEIAAFHSKAKNSSNVPVDYCLVKFVKKPNGSKPGMVIYTNNKTLNVQPKNKKTLIY